MRSGSTSTDVQGVTMKSKKPKLAETSHEKAKDNQFYSQNDEEKNKQLYQLIVETVVSIFPEIQREDIHNFYLCKARKCSKCI